MWGFHGVRNTNMVITNSPVKPPYMHYQVMESNLKFQENRPVYIQQAFMLISHCHIRFPDVLKPPTYPISRFRDKFVIF